MSLRKLQLAVVTYLTTADKSTPMSSELLARLLVAHDKVCELTAKKQEIAARIHGLCIQVQTARKIRDYCIRLMDMSGDANHTVPVARMVSIAVDLCLQLESDSAALRLEYEDVYTLCNVARLDHLSQSLLVAGQVVATTAGDGSEFSYDESDRIVSYKGKSH